MSRFENKFESIRQDWRTPPQILYHIKKEFKFDIDLAAEESNKICPNYYSKEDNALEKEWRGVCWLNPPYGDKDSKLYQWIKKSYQSSTKGDCTIVMLIPARTNTTWWRDYCMKAKEIRFIIGRPKFGEAKHGLPQPLVIVIFQKHSGETKYSSIEFGYEQRLTTFNL